MRGRRLEEELRDARRLEAVGRLAGGVAHDFSNILAVITGYSELMLKRMDPTDPLRTGAESIRKAAVWGLNLTQHMLSHQPGGRRRRRTSLDLNAHRRRRDPHAAAAARRPHRGRAPARAAAGPGDRANAGQLEQTLMNLVLNARDAMPGGGPPHDRDGHATLGAEPAGRGRRSMIRVSDTGCRHGRRHAVARVRAVLHDQAAGQGHRARAGHGLRLRHPERRPRRGHQRGRARLDLHGLPAAGGADAERRGDRGAARRPSPCSWWSRRPACAS